MAEASAADAAAPITMEEPKQNIDAPLEPTQMQSSVSSDSTQASSATPSDSIQVNTEVLLFSLGGQPSSPEALTTLLSETSVTAVSSEGITTLLSETSAASASSEAITTLLSTTSVPAASEALTTLLSEASTSPISSETLITPPSLMDVIKDVSAILSSSQPVTPVSSEATSLTISEAAATSEASAASEEEEEVEEDEAEESPVPVAEDDDEIMKLIGKSKAAKPRLPKKVVPTSTRGDRRERKPSFRVLEAEQHAEEIKQEKQASSAQKLKNNKAATPTKGKTATPVKGTKIVAKPATPTQVSTPAKVPGKRGRPRKEVANGGTPTPPPAAVSPPKKSHKKKIPPAAILAKDTTKVSHKKGASAKQNGDKAAKSHKAKSAPEGAAEPTKKAQKVSQKKR